MASNPSQCVWVGNAACNPRHCVHSGDPTSRIVISVSVQRIETKSLPFRALRHQDPLRRLLTYAEILKALAVRYSLVLCGPVQPVEAAG
jgi:hypothetical protein